MKITKIGQLSTNYVSLGGKTGYVAEVVENSLSARRRVTGKTAQLPP